SPNSLSKAESNFVEHSRLLAETVGSVDESIRLEECTPAPYPCSPIFSAEERTAQLKTLLKIDSKTVSQGFSRWFDIFEEYFGHCFQRCAEDLKKCAKKDLASWKSYKDSLDFIAVQIKTILGVLVAVVSIEEKTLYIDSVNIVQKGFMEQSCSMI